MAPSIPHPIELLPEDYFAPLPSGSLFHGSTAPLEVDAGSGDGTFLLKMAARFPDRNFLGIERLAGRVRRICRLAAAEGLTNLRVLHLESSYTLGWLLPPGCVSRLHLLFPDPWPKKRHAFHRFMHPGNLAAIHRVLGPGATFHFKTDHPDYFQEALEITDTSPLFQRIPWDPSMEFYPTTDFEAQWLASGKTIFAACWRHKAPQRP